MGRKEYSGDKILQEDLEKIVESGIRIRDLENSTILITGATGLIGSLLVKTFAHYNHKKNTNIKIAALVRNLNKAQEIYRGLLEGTGISLVVGDVTKAVHMQESVDYIFHCASVTASKEMVDKPVEALMTAVMGTKNVLDLAALKEIKAFVYISSMEVYGTFENLKRPVTESDSGYVDPLKVRSNYPESKRLCENMCIAYMAEYGVPIKIARLAQTFGAGVLPGENRVFAQFARSVINCKDIVLHTPGNSEGNYVYTRDAVKGLITILLKGKIGEAYNVSNEATHMTIADMAQMVCRDVADGKIMVKVDIPSTNVLGYAEDVKMKLDSGKLRHLGWEPEVGLEEAYKRLIQSMRAGLA